ncbi:hypothetical protein HOLleu_20039 [Holothuria leucospilota]|uniref:Uncharacterized protein n=1 Tax=Holothuria leucospilota TaxID=206669 RepID=A0A9Q1BZ96_HOLLE|nr:hypothetical protein HOLleu_20039 [Holothuria leucospilota]
MPHNSQKSESDQLGELDFHEQLQGILESSQQPVEAGCCLMESKETEEKVIFNSLVSDLGKESAPPTGAKIEDLVGNATHDKLSSTMIREQRQKYHRPSNIELLQIANINTLLWEHLKHMKNRESFKELNI